MISPLSFTPRQATPDTDDTTLDGTDNESIVYAESDYKIDFVNPIEKLCQKEVPALSTSNTSVRNELIGTEYTYLEGLEYLKRV
jgi:hypothetical protein